MTEVEVGTGPSGLNKTWNGPEKNNGLPAGPHTSSRQISLSSSSPTRSVISSVNSSTADPDANKWASFDSDDPDHEHQDNVADKSSDSEQQNLLEDVDALSIAETCSLPEADLFEIDAPSRSYYAEHFERLFKLSTGYDGTSTEYIRAGALEGAHPEVKKFFTTSKLDLEELSHMWRLVDLNQDGFLNLDEFCIAMHLIVLRKKANIPLPQTLPVSLRPAVITPPRVMGGQSDVTPVAGNGVGTSWTTFQSSSSVTGMAAAGAAPAVASGQGSLTASPRDSPRVQFTSEPPELATKIMPKPVPLKTMPQDDYYMRPVGSVGSRSGSQDEYHPGSTAPPQFPPLSSLPAPNGRLGTKALGLLSPKEKPPPPPPPRPPKHGRSASLDLSHGISAPHPPNVPVLSCEQPYHLDAATQTELPPSASSSNLLGSAESAPMLDLELDQSNQMDLMTAGILTARDRCALLRAKNAELEKQLGNMQSNRGKVELAVQKKRNKKRLVK